MTATLVFVGLAPLAFTLVGLLMVMVFALVLSVSHRRGKVNISTLHDPDTAYRDLLEKVRHPWKHRAKTMIRW